MVELPSPANETPQAPFVFERVVVDREVGIGYGVAVADVDGDGRRDVLLVDAREVRWYRAPDWRRFVLCGALTEHDHVAIAARDLDGDGKCEIAVAAGWNPGDTVGSGALFWLEAPVDRTLPWTPRPLPSAPTLHRIAFVRQPGARVGEWSLVGLPLHGRSPADGEGAHLLTLPMPYAEFVAQEGAASAAGHRHDGDHGHEGGHEPGPEHSPVPATASVRPRFEGRLSFREAHGFDVVDRDGDGVEELLVADRSGITPLLRLDGGEFAGDWSGLPLPVSAAPGSAGGVAANTRGCSEVRLGRLRGGRRFLAAIEPFHGDSLTAWLEPGAAGASWRRQVVDASLAEGHALRCGDFLQRGDTQIVAGWRRPDGRGKTGIRIYVPREGRTAGTVSGAIEADDAPPEFDAFPLDESIACEDLALADLDADGRQDIVASGRSTHDLVLFLNRTPWPGAAARALDRRDEIASRDATRAPLDGAALGAIDRALAGAMAQRQLRGAVVAIGRSDGLHFLRAVGDRAVEPARQPMAPDTLFDLASLTKPLVTAALVADLADGEASGAGAAASGFNLDDTLVRWLPEFAADAPPGSPAHAVTIRQCLLHTAGFVPDNEIADYDHGADPAWAKLLAQSPTTPPGERFVYSDVGYQLLGRMIERVHGAPLDLVARRVLFGPLGMTETGFKPHAGSEERVAPTEARGGAMLRGVVHDPRAEKLGGVAGHAGCFSSALDLVRFARMVLNGGELGGVRVLSPEAVARLTTPEPAADGAVRTPGFDARSQFSSNRGATMGSRAFGHGGFTGTGLWIDPDLDLFVVFLSSRLHPDGTGSVNPLIGRVASIAAAAVGRPRAVPEAATDEPCPDPASAAEPFAVKSGADLVVAAAGGRFVGKRIGLVTNHSGRTLDGRPLFEQLHGLRPALDLRVLFTPEHGFLGRSDEAVADGVEPDTGLPIVSLYGERRAPTPEQLAPLDLLLFDVQDAGARCYTYASTLGHCMEAAARAGIGFVVLDRPNPIGGLVAGGPLPDSGRASFTAWHPIPLRHGLTLGELARVFNAERGLSLDLEVIELAGWRRAQLFDATLLPWIDPSPNLRTLDAALLYPGLVLLETTRLSVGRGTDLPFEQFGAPWLDARGLVAALHERRIPGVTFMPVRFTPGASTCARLDCGGVRVQIIDRHALDPMRLVLEIAAQLHARHSDEWNLDELDLLLCSRPTLARLHAGDAPDLIAEDLAREAAAWHERTRPWRLYR